MMTMSDDSFRELLEKIMATTDIMYQAIKADSFEIFESALDERNDYLEKYQSVYDQFKLAKAIEIKEFVGKMTDFDGLIRAELSRYDEKLHEEFANTRKQRNLLLDGQKKTQQYFGGSQQLANEPTFDRKK